MAHIESDQLEGTGKIELRCLECLARIKVPLRSKEVECPNCGTKFLIYWPTPNIAKIKGVARERLP